MNPSRRLAAVVLASTLLSCGSHRTPGVRPPDECGDPSMISQAYKLGWGTVVEVESGDTITVEFPPDKYQIKEGKHKVRLVAIAAPPLDQELGRASKARLEKRLMGRRVEALFSPVQEDGKPLNAMIRVKGGHDIDENIAQIEAGMARSVEQGPYDVDWWTRCHYDKTEERAKAKGRGIWRK